MNRKTTNESLRCPPTAARHTRFLHPATHESHGWARVRRAAAAVVLAYLAVVAVPWLLTQAPALPYVVAAVPEHCEGPSAGTQPCHVPDRDH
jgi:hypothetical protein